MIPKAVLLLCGLLFPLSARGEKRIEYNAAARQAYQYALSLRFQEATSAISRIKSRDPENLVVHHLENYLDFFRLYITEDETEYQRRKKNLENRIAGIQESNQASPYFLYVQADIRLQWALLKIRFGDYFAAFNEISKAHKLLKRNQEKFPNFLPNLKDLGILHALVGTVPDNFRWGVRLLGGMNGTIAQGRTEIEKVLRQSRQQDYFFTDETLLLYAYLLLYLENAPELAWQVVRNAELHPTENPVHCFILASVAMRSGHNEEALQFLQEKPTGSAYFPFPYLDFMLGLAKLRRLDPDAARHFNAYLQQFKGRNYIKEAYQKLAWVEILRKNPAGYQRNLQLCLNKGSAETGPDKNAVEEAKAMTIPNMDLLKARLLFDGGYFQEALELLREKKEADFRNPAHQLEFQYRMGRILHGLKQFDKAVFRYQQTIEQGRSSPLYFACNAALQTGLIYEALKNVDQARLYYRLCLTMYPADYRTSLHQAAKAGLERIED